MNQDKLNFIREKCIAANPEIVVQCSCRCHKGAAVFRNPKTGICLDCKDLSSADRTRPIRLADVLLAIATQRLRLYYSAGDYAVFEVYEESNVFTHEQSWKATGIRWNLRADDLRAQSEETINFIYELLK